MADAARVGTQASDCGGAQAPSRAASLRICSATDAEIRGLTFAAQSLIVVLSACAPSAALLSPVVTFGLVLLTTGLRRLA